jgi:hypothetical protein
MDLIMLPAAGISNRTEGDKIMTFKHNFVWLILASLTLSATVANAQDVEYFNHAELGVGYTNEDNQKLGEYAKELTEEGAFAVGSLYYENRDEDGSALIYIDLLKDAFNSSGSAGYVKPGNLSLEAYGSDSQKIEARDFYLPTTYVGEPDHTDIVNFTPHTFEVERTTFGVVGKKHIGTSAVLSVDYQRQDKDGNKTIAGPDHGPIVGRAVNFEHDEFSMGIEYGKGRLSLGLNYYVSNFTDNDEEFEYCDIGLACGSAIAAEPDNEFSRLETDGSFAVGERTVLNWIGSWSAGEQNEYIVHATDPMRFDGKVDRSFARITLTSIPVRILNYKLEYAARDHDTKNDPIRGLDLGYTSGSRSRRISSVYDKEQDTFKAEVGYRFPNRSKLRIGWRRDDIERTRSTYLDDDFTPGQWIDDTEEDVLWADYRITIAKVQLQAKVETADRDGDQNQNPDWQALYNFDRDRDAFNITGTLPINDNMVLSAGYTVANEEYSPNPTEDLSIALYALWTQFEHRQVASRFYARREPRDDDDFDYQGKDQVDVFGVNLSWQANTRLSLEANLTFSRNDNDLSTAGTYIPLDRDGNPTGPATPYDETLPGYGADTTFLDVYARWQFNQKTSLYARLYYEDWDVDDLTFNGEILHQDGELAMAWNADDDKAGAFIIGLRKNF